MVIMIKNIAIGLLAIGVIVLGYFAVGSRHAALAPAAQTIPPANSHTGASVSTALPAPYVSVQQNWPPTIQNSAAAYACSVGAGNADLGENTVQKIINGRTYCLHTSSEGAAGSSYRTFSYTTASQTGTGTETATFILRYENCSAYDGAQQSQCSAAQSGLDIDGIVGSLM